MTSIYGLIDPRDGQIRYIGKTRAGIEKRLEQHTNSRKHIRSSYWVHSVLGSGYYPEVIELEGGLTEAEWPDAEQFWIAYFKSLGANLTNHTNGGNHVVNKKGGLAPCFPISRQALLDLATNKSLHGTEYRIFCAMVGMSMKRIVATQGVLAERLGMPVAQVSAALRKMAHFGIVSMATMNKPKQYCHEWKHRKPSILTYTINQEFVVGGEK